MPNKNIEWSYVKLSDDVELRGNAGSRVYVVNKSAVAFWSGKDAKDAQAFLDRCVSETEKRYK